MADILSELRWKLKDLLHICKTDQDPNCGWNTKTEPLGNWNMSGELLADTLKRGVVEAEKRGLGDRAEAVYLRLLAPIADPVPAVEEASRFTERLDALSVRHTAEPIVTSPSLVSEAAVSPMTQIALVSQAAVATAAAAYRDFSVTQRVVGKLFPRYRDTAPGAF